jgi:nicotinamide-nucleotide amidase
MCIFDPALTDAATRLLAVLRGRAMKIATAESCTGGLIASLLTEIPGSSDVVDRGFVTYSNAAKAECLGVPTELITTHGAVSAEVAAAMSRGALSRSNADLAIAVTGVAGPGGGTATKPVGLVHLACAERGGVVTPLELRLGDIGRSLVRLKTVAAALDLAMGRLTPV